MKLVSLVLIAAVIPLLAQPPATEPGENINSRYTIESVELSRSIDRHISKSLRRDINSLIGQHFDPKAVEAFATRIRDEMNALVKHRLEKGNEPEHVRLIFDARERRAYEDEAKVTKLVYHQKEGVTAGVQLGFEAAGNRFQAGSGTDADSLLERFTGFNLGYTRQLGDHVRLRFEFESLHEEWNSATQTALLSRPDVPGIYRERYRMDPAIVVLLGHGLSLTAGLSFQHFQTQFPAASYEAANAVTTTLRHRWRWRTSDSSAGHEWDAGYSLRAATSLLGTDYAYTRHQFDARYAVQYGRQYFQFRALAGVVSDRAPLFERFSLGDSRTLRGWNKFDIAPLGGTRTLYGSVQYMYRNFGGFYDTGAVWDRQIPAHTRHAAGVLIALDSDHQGPYLAVGFPLRSGSVIPLLILGMNF